jgi:DNA-binding PadR family transcriptional regulator
MSEPLALGQFEQLVLSAILSLGENAYGVTIHAKIEELVKPRAVKLGAVYATLDRLEDKRLVASWLSEPTKERGGRSRRHYRLEKPGGDALRESIQASRRVCETVEQSWGAFKWKPSTR